MPTPDKECNKWQPKTAKYSYRILCNYKYSAHCTFARCLETNTVQKIIQTSAQITLPLSTEVNKTRNKSTKMGPTKNHNGWMQSSGSRRYTVHYPPHFLLGAISRKRGKIKLRLQLITNTWWCGDVLISTMSLFVATTLCCGDRKHIVIVGFLPWLGLYVTFRYMLSPVCLSYVCLL